MFLFYKQNFQLFNKKLPDISAFAFRAARVLVALEVALGIAVFALFALDFFLVAYYKLLLGLVFVLKDIKKYRVLY